MTVQQSHMPIGAQYVFAVDSMIGLFESLGTDDWAKHVPCTPEWTVRDVLSHVAGVADDITNGRVEGAASDPWTASQVERYRDASALDLLARWRVQAPSVGAVVEAMGEMRPPLDCHTHEHDVRHALGRPGNRDSPLVEIGALALARSIAEGAGISLVFDDGLIVGEDPAVVVRGITRFELFRSALGRRSRTQVAAYAWEGLPDAVERALDGWFAFGPAADPIEE